MRKRKEMLSWSVEGKRKGAGMNTGARGRRRRRREGGEKRSKDDRWK